MIYNDKISSEYGLESPFTGDSPVAYQPKPTGDDYKQGFFVRWFAKRINDNKAVEINPEQSDKINTDLYSIVSVIWKISGPRTPIKTKGIIQKFGVETENQDEIQRIKTETGVDLSYTLTNPLEFWTNNN